MVDKKGENNLQLSKLELHLKNIYQGFEIIDEHLAKVSDHADKLFNQLAEFSKIVSDREAGKTNPNSSH